MSWVTGGSPPFNPDLLTPTDTNEPYMTWLNYVLAQDSLPQVISSKSSTILVALNFYLRLVHVLKLYLDDGSNDLHYLVLTLQSELRR